MNEDSPVKRKIDTEDETEEIDQTNPIQLKRSKSTAQNENDQENHSLKQRIVEEVSKAFNERIEKLESRIKQLETILSLEDEPQKDEKKNTKTDQISVKGFEHKSSAPPLPPRDTSSTSIKVNPNKNTFGASSFNFSPSKTPLSSFTDSPTVPNSPKPVFGATTSFGNMDKRNQTNSSFTTTSKPTNNAPTSTSSQPSSFGFGSSSRFGNAFQESLKKKSFLDTDDKKEDSQPEKPSSSKEATPRPQSEYKQVDLAPIEQSTGEENEKSLFNCTAKLFELNLKSIKDGWKERGVGPLHLNQSKEEPHNIRLVMRSNGLLRVILNYKVTKETEILKDLESSLSPGKYFRLNSLNESSEPIQYLLKFSNETIRNELMEKIESQF